MESYNELNEYLSKGKNKENRPAPYKRNNTRIVRTGSDHISIKLHDTMIVTHFKDGRIKLNTGGWKTITTRTRMNEEQNLFEVYQNKWVWYIIYMGKLYLYEDGMVLNPNGTVESGIGEPINVFKKGGDKKEIKLRNKAKKYCDTFVDKFFNHEIEKPNEGDCFYCSHLVNSSELIDGKVQVTGISDNGDHILSHIKESYYVPSLLYNAIKENKQSGFYGLAPIDEHNLAYYWKMDGWESNKPVMPDMTKKRLKMVLRRYVNKRIGLGVT